MSVGTAREGRPPVGHSPFVVGLGVAGLVARIADLDIADAAAVAARTRNLIEDRQARPALAAFLDNMSQMAARQGAVIRHSFAQPERVTFDIAVPGRMAVQLDIEV